MVSELDPSLTFCDIFKEWSLLFCDREQQLDIMGLLNLPLIYYVTVECWWWTIAFSFGLLMTAKGECNGLLPILGSHIIDHRKKYKILLVSRNAVRILKLKRCPFPSASCFPI